MTVNEQIYSTRQTLGWSRKRLAQLVGCHETTIYDIEKGYAPRNSQWIPDLLAALATEDLPGNLENLTAAGFTPTINGRPRCLVCGILLFPTPDQVPAGWVVEWHVNAGNGNCLEHAGPEWFDKRMKHL